MADISNIIENRNLPILYIIVPCYNEEECIENTAVELKNKLLELITNTIISDNSRILFVNDGSTDRTLELLNKIADNDCTYDIVSFAGNSGHQNAVYAGMMIAKDYADAVISVDADLQQDINAMSSFIDKYKAGCEIVYGIRNDRNSDGIFKKTTALLYYNLMKALGCNLKTNHADYRLMSKRAIEALEQFKENNLFLRGLIPSMGLTSDTVYFDVKERSAGNSKYTLKKMINLALNGITSFSVKPLHIIALLGCFVVIFGIVLSIVSLIEWSLGKNVPGYTTLLMVVLIMSGVILTSLGIIGEYIGKMYLEVKNRPLFIIDYIRHRESSSFEDDNLQK